MVAKEVSAMLVDMWILKKEGYHCKTWEFRQDGKTITRSIVWKEHGDGAFVHKFDFPFGRKKYYQLVVEYEKAMNEAQQNEAAGK